MKKFFYLALFSIFILGISSSHGAGLSPLILETLADPVPVKGSDGRIHLVYELKITNVSPMPWTIHNLQVLSNQDAQEPVLTLSGESLKNKMELLGLRESTNKLGPGQTAVVWLSLAFSKETLIPLSFLHHLEISNGKKKMEERGGLATVSKRVPMLLEPPLRGKGWIAADGCCESTRHLRALLPFQGKLFTAQRFAIDWEQIGSENKIFKGDAKKVESYYCYGKKVYAVGAGKIIQAQDGFPNQIPGKLPEGLPVQEADGNHVIQEIAPGQYALYAHMIPGSLKVKTGDVVQVGQVLGLVGNSGNSSAPHLHFHVTEGPSALGSNGIPYVLSRFELIGKTEGTHAFEEAELKGSSLKIIPVSHPGWHQKELPLDQRVLNF